MPEEEQLTPEERAKLEKFKKDLEAGRRSGEDQTRPPTRKERLEGEEFKPVSPGPYSETAQSAESFLHSGETKPPEETKKTELDLLGQQLDDLRIQVGKKIAQDPQTRVTRDFSRYKDFTHFHRLIRFQGGDLEIDYGEGGVNDGTLSARSRVNNPNYKGGNVEYVIRMSKNADYVVIQEKDVLGYSPTQEYVLDQRASKILTYNVTHDPKPLDSKAVGLAKEVLGLYLQKG